MKTNNKTYQNTFDIYNSSPTKENREVNQNILLNDSDSEEEYPNIIFPEKSTIIKIKYDDDKNKNSKFLGNKHKSKLEHNLEKNIINQNQYSSNLNNSNLKSPKKKSNFLIDSDNNSNIPINLSNDNDVINYTLSKASTKINKNKQKNNIIRINDDDYEDDNENGENDFVVFPYEFTKDVIEALSCGYCQGIYIRPYVINLQGCMHIFCLGCILKMLEDKEIGLCPKCSNQFFLKNIKYSEVTDFYVKTFFPQIPKIIEDNQKLLNDFMKTEAIKNVNEQIKEDKKKISLKCELKPNKNYLLPQKRLPEIVNNHYRFIIDVKSENDNIVSILKRQTIKRINIKLREEEIEIRCGNVELSIFNTYKMVKSFLKPNKNGIITFYYNKK